MWAQWDWGQGPTIGGRVVNLFCAWLAWCRHRVVIPTWDRTLPTVIACVDTSMRTWGGAPTYWLTDNERTVTIDHVAGIAVRHPMIVAAGLHYGVTVATCVPADPESKGGSEATVRVAKADLVPTDTNLRTDYSSWAELVEACEVFMAKVNGREHRVTRRAPIEMLAEEQRRLHRLPDVRLHRSVRGDPEGRRGRRRSVTGVSPTRSRTPWLMIRCGFGSMATRSSLFTSVVLGHSRLPGTGVRRRAPQ